MTIIINPFHLKRNFIVFACLGLLLGVAIWASGRIVRKQMAPQVRVQNKTTALKIVGTRKVGEGVLADLEVTVMNQSDKTVLAYTLSSGEGSVTSFGLSLATGDSKTERIPLTNLEPSPNDKTVSLVRLSAVYFADGTSEGENTDVVRLNNRMLGMQEQAATAFEALQKASSSDEFDPERLTKTIEDEISSTPVTEESSAIASERLAAREFIKEKISREMKEIRKNKSASVYEMRQRLGNLTVAIKAFSS